MSDHLYLFTGNYCLRQGLLALFYSFRRLKFREVTSLRSQKQIIFRLFSAISNELFPPRRLYNATPLTRLGHVPCLGQWAEISHCPPQALFFPSPLRPAISSKTTKYGLFLHLGSEIKKTWSRAMANQIKYVVEQ